MYVCMYVCMYELGATGLATHIQCPRPAQFDDSVVSSGLVAMGDLTCSMRRFYSRRAAREGAAEGRPVQEQWGPSTASLAAAVGEGRPAV